MRAASNRDHGHNNTRGEKVAHKEFWASGDGVVMGVSRQQSQESWALIVRYGRNAAGKPIEVVDVRPAQIWGCNGGGEVEVESLAYVRDLSAGLAKWVVLACISRLPESRTYSLFDIKEQDKVPKKVSTDAGNKEGTSLVTFTVRGRQEDFIFQDSSIVSWITDGPVICVPRVGGYAIAQLAYRGSGGAGGFGWTVHDMPILPNESVHKLLTVGCLGGNCSLPMLLSVARSKDDATDKSCRWECSFLSQPPPLHVVIPVPPQEIAGIAACAVLLPCLHTTREKTAAIAVGTRTNEIVLLDSLGSVLYSVALRASPRTLHVAEAGSAQGTTLLVRSVDSPSQLHILSLRERKSRHVPCGGREAAHILPVALSGTTHAALVVLGSGAGLSQTIESGVCMTVEAAFEQETATSNAGDALSRGLEGGVGGGGRGAGGERQANQGLCKVRECLELKSLGCIRELELLYQQLEDKRMLRQHTHNILVQATAPQNIPAAASARDDVAAAPAGVHNDLSEDRHNTSNPAARPFMVSLGGGGGSFLAGNDAQRNVKVIGNNAPSLLHVQHSYGDGRLLVQATAHNPYAKEMVGVSMCIVANGMRCESRGGTPVVVPPGGHVTVAATAHVIDEMRTCGDWWFECILCWGLDGQTYTTWGACLCIPPAERLRGGTPLIRPALEVACECDVLLRYAASSGGGTLRGVGKIIAEIVGAKSAKQTQGFKQTHNDEQVQGAEQSQGVEQTQGAEGEWVRDTGPWLHITCVERERDARVCLRALDEQSLWLAADTVVSGMPNGVEATIVRGGLEREEYSVRSAVDALIAELDYGVETCRGYGTMDAAEWLKLQAAADRAVALLLQT